MVTSKGAIITIGDGTVKKQAGKLDTFKKGIFQPKVIATKEVKEVSDEVRSFSGAE